MIKFFDVREQYLDHQAAINQEVNFALSTGSYFSYDGHRSLAHKISSAYNGAGVTLTDSGTSALITALTALDLKKNSRVIVPTLTYAATAQAVLAVGCQPVFVDVNKHYLIDINSLSHIHRQYSDISAVIAVDLYGQGSDISTLSAFCKQANIPLIIDAAQSWGICSYRYDQTIADAVCLSFNPLKNFGGLGGGAVVSNKIDPNKLHAITHCGKDELGNIRYKGGNYRMGSVQAAVLLAKLLDSDTGNQDRKLDIDQAYRNAFGHLMPAYTPWSWTHRRTVYVSVIAPKKPAQVRCALTENKIEFRSHYDRPLHMEPLFQTDTHPLILAESLAGRLISLPNNYHITDEQVHQVIETVCSAL
jgi:dTDP-4-amino-4,6-dideoxygalactose transaminase